MIRNIYIIIFSFLIGQFIFSQSNQDARMMGLNGTYTTLASGFRTVGINPANLAVYQNNSWNLFDFSFGLSNNFFSIENYNTLSGSHLEDTTHVNYYPKELILDEFGGKGFRITQSFNFPIQPLNISADRFALTSRLISNIDIGLSDGMVRFLFTGNPLKEHYYLDIEEMIISIQEIGISYGHSFKGFSAGFTLKYLSGLFFMGMEPISSQMVTTDSHGLYGNPQYIIRQGVGGKGIGLDVGIITDESKDGFRYGMSLINLLGKVNWTQTNLNQMLMDPIGIWGSHLFGLSFSEFTKSEYYLRPNEFVVVNFVLDSITASSFSNDSLMYYEMYKVMHLNNINNIEMSLQDSGLVIMLEDDTYLYPSGGTYSLVDLLGDLDTTYTVLDNYSEYSEKDAHPFITRQPMFLRLGASKLLEGQAIVAVDLVTGFSNRFGSTSAWRFSMGTEIIRFTNKFFRLGYAIGGGIEKSLSLGYGAKMDRLYFDIGLSLNGGFTLGSAKGFDLATGIIWQFN